MKHDLWSTPLWHIEGAPQQLVDELYQGAYIAKKNYTSATHSNIGGYQSPNILWEEFHPEGIKYVNAIIDNIFKKETDFNIEVQRWWFNINGKGDWNRPHSHPGSDFALVLYVTDSDKLLHLLSPFPQRILERSADHVNVDAKKGDILIFPADIYHYVLPNPREEDRISISMNLQLC